MNGFQMDHTEIEEGAIPLDALPELARSKVERLEDEALNRRVEILAQQEKVNALRGQRNELLEQIGHMERQRERSGSNWTKKDEARLEAMRAKLATITKRLREAQPVATPTPEAVTDTDKISKRKSRLRNEIFNSLNPSPAQLFAEQSPYAKFITKRAELPKGDLDAALKKTRARQDAIISELVDLDDMPLDFETAKLQMEYRVDLMAEEGAPDVSQLTIYTKRFETGGKKSQGDIGWPRRPIFNPAMTESAEVELGVAFTTWLFRDDIKKRLAADIRERLAGQKTMSIPERHQREADLRAEYLQLQRLEVRICEELSLPLRRVHPLAYFEMDRDKDAPAPDFGAGTAYRGEEKGRAPTIGVPVAPMGAK